MRKIGLGSGFVGFVRIGQILTNLTDTRDWYEVTAVADSSIQLRCIHPYVLVLIQPRSRLAKCSFSLFLLGVFVQRNMSVANIRKSEKDHVQAHMHLVST